MKRHTFKVIHWLGEEQQRDRFAIVEVDRLGPVLRAGPFKTRRYANQRADILRTRAEPRSRRERPQQ